MFDRQFLQSKLGFFKTKLGRAATLSVGAMLAMNIVALNAQLDAAPMAYAASTETAVDAAPMAYAASTETAVELA